MQSNLTNYVMFGKKFLLRKVIWPWLLLLTSFWYCKLIRLCETMLQRFLCLMQAPKICKTRQIQHSYTHPRPRCRGPCISHCRSGTLMWYETKSCISAQHQDVCTQAGMCTGVFAVCLCAWHSDIPSVKQTHHLDQGCWKLSCCVFYTPKVLRQNACFIKHN